jgi:hypothetical protein
LQQVFVPAMTATEIFLTMLLAPTYGYDKADGEKCDKSTECKGICEGCMKTDATCSYIDDDDDGACRACTTNTECENEHGSSVYECKSGECEWTSDTWGDYSCSCDQKCIDDYYGKMMGGSAAAAVIGIAAIVAASLPCCCGIDCDNPIIPKVIGGITAFVGIFIIFIPLMAASGAADGATDDVCSECDNGCTDDDKKKVKESLTALGVIVAYTLGCGFWACLFGPLATGLGLGAVCQCCGPLAKKGQQGQPMVVNGVVQQPVVVGSAVNIKASE